jgi:hypothetical protein
MTYFPDTRTDDTYNQDKLNSINKEFVKGYDWCVIQLENFFETFGESDEYIDHILSEKVSENIAEDFADDDVKTYADFLLFKAKNWIESSRDEMIVAMLNGQSAEGDDPE